MYLFYVMIMRNYYLDKFYIYYLNNFLNNKISNHYIIIIKNIIITMKYNIALIGFGKWAKIVSNEDKKRFKATTYGSLNVLYLHITKMRTKSNSFRNAKSQADFKV